MGIISWIRSTFALVDVRVIAYAALAGLVLLALRALAHWMRPENPDRTGNGIAAGSIKTYDNRFLSIRLDELEASLEKLAAIDPQSLATDLGAVQGKIASTVELGIIAGQEPPKNEAAGKDAAAPEGSKIGQSARDRLAELINLRYEILGLRMILERSLSDRLWEDGTQNDARLQAVLGLQVSLDPPKDCVGCAAVVEVTFREKSGKPLSLVALLPQERTNNMLFVSNQSQSAAGTAKAKQSSFWWRRKSESVSNVREPDTVAFQRPPQSYSSSNGPVYPAREQESLTVGWQFRPPLDRPAVVPGVRQVFAILALPAIDKVPDQGDGRPPLDLQATVATYWRRYDGKSRTTAPRWFLGSWLLKDHRREELIQKIDVNYTKETQEQLKPEVHAIQTTLVGPDKVVVTVDGRNFFQGTTVATGAEKVHSDPASGLLIKSDHHMQITTTPKALAYGNGVINGRYGPTVPLKVDPPVKDTWVAWCGVEPYPDGKFHWLEIYVSSGTPSSVLTLARLGELPSPIVTVDDHVLPPPYYITNEYRDDPDLSGFAFEPDGAGGKINCVAISAWVPAQWNPLSARFKLIFPFCGDGYQQAFGISKFDPTFSVVRWARDNSHSFLITITGGDFEILEHWKVELDKEYTLVPTVSELVRLSNLQLLLTVPASRVKDCERILIRHIDEDKTLSVYPQEIPPAVAPLKPTLSNTPVEISAKSSSFVKIEGTLLDSVGKVQLSRTGLTAATVLEFFPTPDKSGISVYVPAGQAVGFGQLLVEDSSGAELGKIRVVVKD